MPSKEEVLERCLTVSELPASFGKHEVTALLAKKSTTVAKLEQVVGGEADDSLSRWVVYFNSAKDAEYFHRDVGHEEIQTDSGDYVTIRYLETTECEVPGDWINMDDDDLESDGDPEKPPEPPKKSKPIPGPSQVYPSMDQAQPFAASGFYHNVSTSGAPGQPNIAGFQPQFGYPMGQGNPGFMPQGPPSGPYRPGGPQSGQFGNLRMPQPGQPGPSGQPGQGQPFYPPQSMPMPMYFDEKTKQYYQVPPQYLQQQISPRGPYPGGAAPGGSQDAPDNRGSPPPYSSGEMGSDNTPNYKSGTPGGQSSAVRDQIHQYEKFQQKHQEREEDEAPRTKIVVSDLPDGIEEEYLEMLFENKKKQGGGTVTSIELDQNKAQAIIEFEEPSAVDIVMDKLPIKVKSREVRIEVFVPKPEPSEPLQDEEPAATDERPTKILVSEVPRKVDADYLEMFFENTKKFGGGPIADIELNEEDGVAIVEFKTPEAVEQVLQKQRSRPIVMSGVEIRVEAYIPEVPRDDTQDLLGGEGPAMKVLVMKIPGKALDEEYLEMFFEKNGGEVFDIKLIEEFSAAVIEFDEASAVEKVMSKQLSKPLLLAKTEVEILPYNPRYVLRDTIEVRGEDMDAEVLEMWFETEKRSNGGPIVKLDLREDEDVAYITYESENVAKRVADQSHTVSKKQLQVEIYQPSDPLMDFLRSRYGSDEAAEDQNGGAADKKSKKSKSKGSKAEPESKTTRIVKVRGMNKVRSRETVQFYFENKRRSGGGEVETLRMDDEDSNVMFVTFKSEQDAVGVCERASHQVEGCELSVSLYFPPPPRPVYEDRLLIRGIKPTTTRDCLFNFLEAKSGGVIPEEQQQGEKDDVRLVSFRDPIDFDKLQQNARTLEGANLRLEKVTVSNCIYVANYDESLGKDTIELYFESETRSGGGQVEKVQFKENEGYWLVFFADYEVIDNVLHREHKLGPNKLVVKLFVESLGQPQGGEGEMRFKIPDPIVIASPETQKIKFILSSNNSKQGIEMQMGGCNAKINWPSKDAKPPLPVKIECTLTQKTKNCYKLAKEWKQKAQKDFEDYLKTITVMQNSVRGELWSDVVKSLQEITIDNPDAVAVFVEKDQGNVTVVGVKKPSENLSSDIRQRIKVIEEQADRQKQRVKETVTTLKLIDTKMLLAIKYPTKMEEKYKELKVKINQNKNELTFDGLGRDIMAAKLDMHEMRNSFVVRLIKDIPQQGLGMYMLKQVKEYIVKTLKQRNVPAVWEVENDELIVCSASQQTLMPSVKLIEGAVKTNTIPLSKASRSIVNTDKWDSMVQDLQARHPGKVMITAGDLSNVIISTTDDVEQEIVSVVKKFLSTNSILDEKLQLSSSDIQLLTKHHKTEVDSIARSLVGEHVQVVWDRGGFNISGNEKGIAAAKAQLQQLASKVQSKEHSIEKPGLALYVNKPEGKENISHVENKLSCVINIKGQSDDDDMYAGSGPSHGGYGGDRGYSGGATGGGGGGGGPGPNLPPGMRLHASCTTPDDRKLFTVEGDMTEMNVDILVNTADKKLSLAGGLGKVIVTKGGRAVRDACSDYISSVRHLGGGAARGRAVRDACSDYISQYDTLEEGAVFLSPGGNLKAGSVVHVVGPAWQSGQNREKDRLKEAVSKVMQQAAMKKVSSIAFPAISCGTFGFPSKVATSVIVQAVQNFFREDQDCSISTVYLCDVKRETIEGFTDAMDKCFGGVKLAPGKKSQPTPTPRQQSDSDRPKPRPRTGVQVLPTMGAPSKKPLGTKVVIGNIQVTIVKGELAKEKVNVIVNTTADNLDLTNGAVSNSLLKAAGKQLQDEVSANHPGKLTHGEIVKTQGYNLTADMVLHTALPSYNQGPALKVLQGVMDKCLSETSKQNFARVAFPAIGTGNLKFPKDVVAKEMYKAVEAFTKKSPRSSLTDVKFVVYHMDTATVKAFEAEESKWLTGKRVVAERGRRDFGNYTSYQELNADSSGSDSGTDYEIMDDDYDDYTKHSDMTDSGSGGGSPFGAVNVTVKQGDITREACDCIVNSSNEDLDLSRGAVSQALLRKGGKTLETELKSKRDKMRRESIAMTKAPGLQCGNIIHIVAQDSHAGWKKMTTKCLEYAEKKQLRCIAFPALGTGISMKAADIAEVMVSALVGFAATGPKYVREVRFVIFQKEMEGDFNQAVQNANRSNQGFLSKAWHGVKAMAGYGPQSKDPGAVPKRRGGGKPPGDPNKVTFKIYAMSHDVIKQAIDKLESILDKAVFKKEFNDSTIQRLNHNQVQDIKSLAKQNHVGIQFDDRRGTIEISGMATKVMDVTDKIYGVFRQADELEHQKNEASLIANITQWFFMEVTETENKLTKYDEESNRKIEKAFQAQEKSVDLRDNTGAVYVVDFNKMEEYPQTNPNDTVQIIRRDLMKEGSFEPPTTWSKMGDTENLKVVPLQPSDKEYTDLVTKFQASANHPFNVTKIERVQNKTLWQQYQAKKKQLEQQNPPNTQNERQLWHGFAVDAMDSINAHGFNRSYCGKNATAFGDGVYFAVNAGYSCSDTYSRPDNSGIKHMYLCYVLTGEYIRGQHGMRVPPQKATGGAVALYDSVVNNVANPAMYIIFNDTQAYPEYVVHFKK